MSARPSNAALMRYLDGEEVAEVASWLDADASAADELDAVIASADAEPLPKAIGKYLVERKLGEGAMGVVYLAYHDKLKCDVAVKVIRPQWASEPGFRQRFNREGHLLVKVKGANVVAVHDADEHDGNPFLVMEYVGINFEQWLKANGTRDAAANVLWVGVQVLTGLRSIHESQEKLIHRDIKPSNLGVTNGMVKIIDFGVATFDGKKTVHAGTTAYMAPEVAAGGEATAQSDLYSVGAVLYEVATGKRVGEVKTNLADEPKFQELPPTLRGFVLGLLDKANRPESARAALARLEAIRDRKPPTNPWAWWTVGVSAILGLVIVGWLLARADRARTVEGIRATEVELDRALSELNEAVTELNDAQIMHLQGANDPAAKLNAAGRFQHATDRYNSAKGRIDAAHRTRAELLDRMAK